MARQRIEPREGKLETAIVEFLLAVERGNAPDLQQLLAQHADIADELQLFFANHAHMQRATRRELQAAVQPRNGTEGSEGETLSPEETPAIEPPGPIVEANRFFGDYELLGEINRGGMGVIFKARQISLNRIVALKMIKSGDLASEEEIRRFYAEAEAAASLTHPGIVPIYDFGHHHGRHYFSMRFIEGTTLTEKLAAGPLSPSEAALLTQKIAEAVAYAHQRGVVHRDLKPANVLLDESGEPMITDFGLALNRNVDRHLTATGQILGTPAFMAPEQAAGEKQATTELADIYSIGAILYTLCTGCPPFESTNPLDILLQVIDREPALPTSVNRQLPKALEHICLRCLEKKSSFRYPSAESLAADLRRFQVGEPVEARAGFTQRIRRWAGREPALVSHLAGIASVALIEVVAFFVLASDVAYFLRHVGVLLVWAVVSFLLQKILNLAAWANTARFAWAAADVLFFSTVLYMAEPPRGPLLIGYPLLVAASGLFSRVRLVLFTTITCLVAFAALMLATPEEPKKPHFCIIFAAALVVLGGIVAAQVRRLRALSRYYERAD